MPNEEKDANFNADEIVFLAPELVTLLGEMQKASEDVWERALEILRQAERDGATLEEAIDLIERLL